MIRSSAVVGVLLFGAAMLFPTPVQAAAITSANASNSSNGHEFEVMGPPAGFEDLSNPREVLVDVYFGGRKLGSAVAMARPASFSSASPPRSQPCFLTSLRRQP